MMRRKIGLMTAVIPVVLLVADMGWWSIASSRLRAGVAGWMQAQRSHGWEVQSDAMTTGGWPLLATVTVPNLRMRHTGSDIPGDMEWRSVSTTIKLSLFMPSEADIVFEGPQRLHIGTAADLIVSGDAMNATVPLRAEGWRSIDFHASDLKLSPAAGAWTASAGLLTCHAELTAEPDAQPAQQSLAYDLSAEAISLPADVKWPLGPHVSSLAMEGTLNGLPPPGANGTARAEAWRDAGGSLEIKHIAMGWGSLGLAGSATLALDDQLQPMGTGNSRIIGYAETLDRLAGAGLLSKSAAIAAKAVLSLMAGAGDGDAPLAVDVPLTLQYRTLSMRQVPLLRFPELDWPER